MSDNYLVLKIAGGVVLGLLVWNAFERYQQQKALEEGMRELQRVMADPDPMGLQAELARRRRIANSAAANAIKPIPPGYRCEQGALLKRIDGGWLQVTDRNNEWYCPPGGTANDCYRVSAQSTGCR